MLDYCDHRTIQILSLELYPPTSSFIWKDPVAFPAYPKENETENVSPFLAKANEQNGIILKLLLLESHSSQDCCVLE